MSGLPPSIPGLTYLQHLGAGGYADVYLYDQAMPQRRVAVKVLRESGLSSAALAQFRTEANAMATLAHPNIVPVYAAGTTPDGRPYIVMMFYPRASLGERVKAGRMPVAEVLQIGIKLASAVETAHRAGILHRDIKPANVLTDQYGNPGLGDFGIAAEASAADDDDLGVSVPWSPPELLYATGAPSVRSDVYSLAATIWHLLVGRSPFEVPGGDNSQYELMKRIRDTAPPATGRPDVPTAFDRLLRAGLAKDPAHRPASALEFARSLQAIEQELRLPRTDLVLASDELGHTVSRPGRPTEDATRMHSRVDAQGPVVPPRLSVPTSVEAPAATEGPRKKSAMLGIDGEDATLHRAVVSNDSAPDEAERAPVSRWWLWVAVAVVVVGAVALSSVFWWRPEVPLPATPSESESSSTPDPGLNLPPGKPAITGTRSGASVTFTWTYANAMSNDTFAWKASEEGEVQRTDKPTITLADQPEGQVCVFVRVIRFSGNDAQRDFTKGCTP